VTESAELAKYNSPPAACPVLRLLGDELIGSPPAVFELVKNAYDADANEVKVPPTRPGHERRSSRTTATMTEEILKTVWLVLRRLPGEAAQGRNARQSTPAAAGRERARPLRGP
jgi:hypothetical protein